ncbi:hypothetical protein I7I50_04563 [Histoplasma capsulatum G186AR]|uniref:Uncharacterized protein n=1 Tax=Ajellomyces capsulatus TaxID=5037 RepID=A0A8H7YMU8_AJECA|nr:hypothetical protein I7I52_05472 [Histoplasma capsulatum]QSS75433.1 hypothetical protein I7I50_04563 [Histoplasma capsulatum G186AR]
MVILWDILSGFELLAQSQLFVNFFFGFRWLAAIVRSLRTLKWKICLSDLQGGLLNNPALSGSEILDSGAFPPCYKN